MTEPSPVATDRPLPADALEARFRDIQQRQMADMPLLNPALRVRAVGFQPWDQHWLGVLLTPWFMNLLLLPRVQARWPAVTGGASRHCVFPAGVFEFIAHHDPVLGDYLACSLFSPMADFADQAGAEATAAAALQALFDVRQRPAPDRPDRPARAPAAPVLRKRDFLFGAVARTPRDPRG